MAHVYKNKNCEHIGWHVSGLFMQPLPCSRHLFSSQPQEWHHRFDICWSWWRPWQCQRSGHQHWPKPGLPSSPAWPGTHFLLLLLLHLPTQTPNHSWTQQDQPVLLLHLLTQTANHNWSQQDQSVLLLHLPTQIANHNWAQQDGALVNCLCLLCMVCTPVHAMQMTLDCVALHQPHKVSRFGQTMAYTYLMTQ